MPRAAQRKFDAKPENKLKAREYKYKWRYGITLDEYNQLLTRQDGHCALCCATPASEGFNLAVDHDKLTGKIRGLLCRKHNVALGTLGDTEAGLFRAIDYLRGNNV